MTGELREPLTLPEVEQEIHRLIGEMEDSTEKLYDLGEKMARTEANHKRERAKQYLSAEGPVHAREATADEETAEMLFERRVAEVRYESERERLRTIRAALDALRSINANARAQT